MAKPDHSIRIQPEKARQGRISGRVIVVLVVSLTLALLAMIALLGYFYPRFWLLSPP